MDFRLVRSSPRLVLVFVVAQMLFAIVPPPASAAEVCWKMLVNDYWADRRLDRPYSVSCFREAIDKLPPDVREYSDAQDELRRALALAVRDRYDRGDDPPEGLTPQPAPTAETAPPDESAPRGFFEETLDRVAPKNADAVPVQVLVLGALALILIGSSVVSRLKEYLQARRAAHARTT
jgi:hypothetical protein